MKKNFLLLLLISIVAISCSKEATNEPEVNLKEEYVKSIFQNGNLDSLINNVAVLSGAKSYQNGNEQILIKGRNSNYPGNDLAANYIEKRLKSFGLSVQNHNYRTGGRNVIGKLVGSSYPNEYYIICAHYDSMPKDSIAPGADDNASGTSAVIEAARLLSKYKPNYSILFALWDEEEQGLIGSRYYAGQAVAENMVIKGVINLDMISYNSDALEDVRVGIAASDKNIDLTDALKTINSQFNLGLTLNLSPGSGSSDHVSFWEKGYNAIMLIESSTDFNKYYHKNTDMLDKFNNEYFRKISKLAITTLAQLAL